MKKICLGVVGIVLTYFAAYAQSSNDSSNYKSRKLSFEEANLVSSYYKQDGSNASVTGGIGSQRLSDISNTIDVKFIKWDRKNRKHSFDLEVGIDHYTSASSDQVDLKANSSASHEDTRIFPSLSWSVEDETKGLTFGAGLSASAEYDYQSTGINANFSKKTNNKNGEFTLKAQAYFDKVSLIYPTELRNNGGGAEDGSGATARNSYSGSLSYSQIINQRLHLMFIAELISQKGYLSLPFYRVFFNDNSVHIEKLPGSRTKIPLGFRANYFLGDKVILKSFYRFYRDNWGLTAHTAEIETPIKITPFVSVSPFYRYYQQSSVDYFAPYKGHASSNQYYTSNYDLSKFSSNFYGTGFRMTPAKGVFGIQRLNMLEIRYGHYSRSNGLSSDVISLNLKFK